MEEEKTLQEEVIDTSTPEGKLKKEVEDKQIEFVESIEKLLDLNTVLNEKMTEFKVEARLLCFSELDYFFTINRAIKNIDRHISRNRDIDKYIETIKSIPSCAKWGEEGGCIYELVIAYEKYREKLNETVNTKRELNKLERDLTKLTKKMSKGSKREALLKFLTKSSSKFKIRERTFGRLFKK